MYKIFADGECIYSDEYVSESYRVSSPKLKMADSAAGSLEMVLPPTNVGYDKLKRMTSTIVVKRYDDEIWEGRIVEDSYNFYNERTVYCEGALAYFNDTCQPQCIYTNCLLEQFLQAVFDVHNKKVREDRRIYYDFQNVTSEFIEKRVTQYEKTLETLNQVCIDYECHMRIVRRRENIAGEGEEPVYVTKKYVQFFKGAANTTAQTVEFGKNLLDYSSDFNLSNLATVVLPLGAAKERESNGGIGPAIDLTRVSEGDVGTMIENQGYYVFKALEEMTCLNFQDAVEQGGDRIIPVLGGYSYYTAIVAIRASLKPPIVTEDKPNKIYLSSRMHGGRGMYLCYTPFDYRTDPNGGTYHSGKYASTNEGFTDSVEEGISVPDTNDPNAAKYYVYYIGSFGGDIQLRLNLQNEIDDETLDEYYTAEDAMVSQTCIRSTTPALENGNLAIDSGNVGGNTDDGNTLYLRTTDWIADDHSVPFNNGLFNVDLAVNTNKLVQARVFHSSATGPEKSYDEWKNCPAKFKVDADKYERIRVVFRYADKKSEINANQVTGFSINKGTIYGSLYVTAQSRNLFNDTVDRGEIFDDGPLIGEDNTAISLTQLRNSKKLCRIDLNGELKGFEAGNYLLSGKMTKTSDDDNRILQARIFHYDFATGVYKSMDAWTNLPVQITVPSSSQDPDPGEYLRFAFRFADESNISIASISDIQLEQGVTTPSIYERPNTALEEYGWIETCMNLGDVTDPDQLYYKAKQHLSSGQFDHMTLDVKALDLSVLGVNVDAVNVNDYIRVLSVPHGLDRYFEVSEIEIPLDKPEDMTFSLGAETEQNLTTINNNLNDDLLKMIEETPSMGAILQTAKTESDKILRAGFANSYMVVLLDDDDHPSGLGFFKVPAADPDDDPVPTNDVPDAHWSNIDGNPRYNNSEVLLINDDGIGFYGNGLDEDPTISLVNAKGQIVADAIVAGTMLADHMRGGTLALGHWIMTDGVSNPGVLYVLADSYDSIIHTADSSEAWSDHMIEMTKDDGFVQQGRATDGFFRQVKAFDGILSGAVYFEQTHPDHGWHTGGELLMCTVYGESAPYAYGIEMRSNYITKITSASDIMLISTGGKIELNPSREGITVKSTQSSTPLQTVNQAVSFGPGDNVRLEFTHGLLTGFSVT